MAAAPPGRPRDLLVSGHVNLDRFLSVDTFPSADRTAPVRSSRDELGGTGANLALVAARFGLAVGLVARVGEGFPTSFVRRLRAARVDLRGLQRIRNRATPVCYIVEDRQRSQRTLIDQGAASDLRQASLPGPWIREYSWLHVTTGDPDFQLRLAARARRSGLRVAADPAQEIHYRWDRRRLRALLSMSELLCGNRAEVARAAELAGARSQAALLEQVPLIVRTEGEHGASAFFRGGGVHVPSVRVESVRTRVGAGDAFRGGFYAAWFAGEPIRSCLTAGVRAAGRWVRRGR